MLATLNFGMREYKIGGPLFQTASMHASTYEYVLYDELTLQGVIYGRNSCMMKQEF